MSVMFCTTYTSTLSNYPKNILLRTIPIIKDKEENIGIVALVLLQTPTRLSLHGSGALFEAVTRLY